MEDVYSPTIVTQTPNTVNRPTQKRRYLVNGIKVKVFQHERQQTFWPALNQNMYNHRHVYQQNMRSCSTSVSVPCSIFGCCLTLLLVPDSSMFFQQLRDTTVWLVWLQQFAFIISSISFVLRQYFEKRPIFDLLCLQLLCIRQGFQTYIQRFSDYVFDKLVYIVHVGKPTSTFSKEIFRCHILIRVGV